MAGPATIGEPLRINEPTAAPEFSDALSRVAADGRPLIVQRNGQDVAAVISMEQLRLLNDAAAREHAESLASEIDWSEYAASHAPPQSWFDGEEPKPF